MTGSDSLVRTDFAGGVFTLSYNRPGKHNAMSNELVAQWQGELSGALADPKVRVVVLRGEGKSFSSGRDTEQLGGREPGDTDFDFVSRAQARALLRLDSTKPIIAALKGYVLGGALETALTADIRIAATDAKMGFPEIRHGLVTDTGGIPLTTKLAGSSRAKYLVMTGNRIDAAQAMAWGLVDLVVEPDELDRVTQEVAARIAEAPAQHLAMIKQIARTCESASVRDGLNAELYAQTAIFSQRKQHVETA